MMIERMNDEVNLIFISTADIIRQMKQIELNLTINAVPKFEHPLCEQVEKILHLLFVVSSLKALDNHHLQYCSLKFLRWLYF